MDTNTFVGNLIDRGPWILYDTLAIAAGVSTGTSQQPFSLPISASKTKLATNMTKANQLPPPQRFLLQGIGFYFDAATVKSDIDLFTNNCYFEFRIDQKIYHEGRLDFFPAGVGTTGTTTKNNESAWNNGQPTLTAMRRFGDYSRVISDNQQFTMNLVFPTAQTIVNALNLICILDGILDRSVQ